MNRERTILVVDDEVASRQTIAEELQRRGHRVVTAAGGREALDKLDDAVDLLLTDLRMPDVDGLTVLTESRARGFREPIIVMTSHATVASAVEAMRRGAFDYVTKPIDFDELAILVARAFEVDGLYSENHYLRSNNDKDFAELVGRSLPMRAMREQIQSVATSHAPVLILGETGTGKELVARAVHRESGRAGLFVPINCAAIPAELLESELFGHVRGAFTGAVEQRTGKLELASGGTLFLDEIGDMPLALQAKLLRVLENSFIERVGSNRPIRVDIRFVSATHRNLSTAVARGAFRQDLLYRLDVLEIRVPPLRERDGDIAELAQHFLGLASAGTGRAPLLLEEEAIDLLEGYAWPGNVRELKNVCERLTVRCTEGRVDADLVAHLLDLPAEGVRQADAPGTLASIVARAESDAIRAALERTGDNKAKAARMLGISERSLWYKIKRYRISVSEIA